MAQLKDTVIQGSARVTNTLYADTVQLNKLLAPITAGGTTHGPGSNQYVLTSDGTSVYWGDTILEAIYNLDVASVGATNGSKYIAAISETDGKIAATAVDVATTYSPTGTVAISGTGVAAALATLDVASVGGGTGEYISAISEVDGKISATKTKITVSNAWTAGTTAGPKISTTVHGVTGTAVAIPSASASASGAVTTGAQVFAGDKTFNSDNFTIKASTIRIQNKAGNTSQAKQGTDNATVHPYVTSLLIGDGREVTIDEYGDGYLGIHAKYGIFIQSNGTDIKVYDPTKTYAVNNLVWYDRKYYRCTTAIEEAQEWTVANWTAIPASAGTIVIDGSVSPITTNTKTLGTSTYRWSKLYIGTADSYGSTTQPVYWNAGVPKACTTYAGGTAVTLNNSSKAGSTASFYAPTAGGAQNTQALVGNGTTSAPKWVNISPSITITAGDGSNAPKVNVTVLGQSGTAQAITKATTSIYGVTKLSSTSSTSEEGLAATPKGVWAAINTLDVTSVGVAAATGNRFISQIGETDGKISAVLATATIGSTTQPIWIDGGTLKATSYALNAAINAGTITRIAYYSGANAISSGTIETDGTYLKLEKKLYLGAFSQTVAPNISGINIPDNRSVAHLPNTFGSQVVQWYFDDGATDTGRNGWSTIMHMKGWSDTNYAAHQISFNAHSDSTDGNLYHRTGSSNTWKTYNVFNADPSAAVTTTTWRKVLDNVNINEDTDSPFVLTTINKSIIINQTWKDTGISGTNIPVNGSYIVQVFINTSTANTFAQATEYYTGFMSWYSGTCQNADDANGADEIILHRAGANSIGKNIYLRTVRVANGSMKLQIKGSMDSTVTTPIYFRFRRVI